VTNRGSWCVEDGVAQSATVDLSSDQGTLFYRRTLFYCVSTIRNTILGTRGYSAGGQMGALSVSMTTATTGTIPTENPAEYAGFRTGLDPPSNLEGLAKKPMPTVRYEVVVPKVSIG
jgi:hypothetical protein